MNGIKNFLKKRKTPIIDKPKALVGIRADIAEVIELRRRLLVYKPMSPDELVRKLKTEFQQLILDFTELTPVDDWPKCEILDELKNEN